MNRNRRSYRSICLLSVSSLVVLLWTGATFFFLGMDPVFAAGGPTTTADAVKLTKTLPKIMITAEAALRQVKSNPSTVLVDVRDQESFRKVGIPGALNIPLHFIKAKQRLKKSSLILVGEGYGYRKALTTCMALQGSGFNARVLFGGLPAWRVAGGAVEGDLTVLAQYKYIPPSAFHTDLVDGLILPISLKQADSKKKNDLHDVVYLGVEDAPEKLPKQLKALNSKTRDKMSYQTAVIIDAVDMEAASIETSLNKAGINNLRYLKGGMTAYSRHLNNISRLGKSRDDRLVTAGNKLPCEDEEDTQSDN